jgi:hypothetical protein
MNQDNPIGKVMGYRLDDRNFIPRSVNISRFGNAEDIFASVCEAI